jgi:LysM repeat protein
MSNSDKQIPVPEIKTEAASQQYKHQLKPDTVNANDTFIGEGKSNAITINTPFTVIPGLPELNKILARIDRTTQQDLGFTFKASAEKVQNSEGLQDLKVRLDYIGFGIMSSKFNVQYSPLSVKIESGSFNTEPHWGCSASVLSSPIGLVHERAGVKGTFSDCNGSRTFSAAPEFSYQSSKTFKPLSTATGGYFFVDSATFNIPNAMLPIIEKIKADGPGLAEWEVIADHVLPSIPAIQIGRLIDQQIEVVSDIANTAIANVESIIQPVAKSDVVQPVAQQTYTSAEKLQPTLVAGELTNENQQIKTAEKPPALPVPTLQVSEPTEQEKTHYRVQQKDTLSSIGKKTGHTWMEIFALNKSELKNNPDNIYPGQELSIPNNDDHIILMEHPVVKAQILANLAKHNEVVAQSANDNMTQAT